MNRIIAVVAVLTLSGCASSPKVLNCNKDPQFWATDAKGVVTTEIRLCFASNHAVLWDSRPAAPPSVAAPADPADAEVLKKMDKTLKKVERKAKAQREAEAAKK